MCSGGQIRWDNGDRQGIVFWQQDSILLEEVEIMVAEDESMIAKGSEQKHLPCRYKDEYCATQSGTYLWTAESATQACNFYQLRTVHGKEMESADGTVFVLSLIHI